MYMHIFTTWFLFNLRSILVRVRLGHCKVEMFTGIPFPFPMGIPWEWESLAKMGMGMGGNGNQSSWEWEWHLYPWESVPIVLSANASYSSLFSENVWRRIVACCHGSLKSHRPIGHTGSESGPVCPASSSASERVFSTAGRLLEKRRSNLSPALQTACCFYTAICRYKRRLRL